MDEDKEKIRYLDSFLLGMAMGMMFSIATQLIFEVFLK